MQLQLRKFNLDWIPDDSNIVLIGKKATGKSVTTKDILYHKRNIPVGTVVSATENANKFYGKFIPDIFIFDNYAPYIVDNALKRQRKVVQHMNAEIERNGSSRIDPRTFLVLDDCMYDDTWTRQPAIREIFMNGRHWRFTFMVTMQTPLGIPPALRTNVDFTFILRENLISNRKRIYENYAGMFPTFDVFCQVMNQCTEDYECLVIQNNSKSNRLEDQVFWYKSKIRDDFQMGSPEFWALSRERAASRAYEEDDEYIEMHPIERNPALDMRSRKTGPMVTVRKRI